MNKLLENFTLEEISETDTGEKVLVYCTNTDVNDGAKAFESLTGQTVESVFAQSDEDKASLSGFTAAIEINSETGELSMTISPAVHTDDSDSDIEPTGTNLNIADITEFVLAHAANELSEELVYKIKEQALTQVILDIGDDAISDFLDFDTRHMSLDDIKDVINDVLAQMPDDIFDLYYEKYITNRKEN